MNQLRLLGTRFSLLTRAFCCDWQSNVGSLVTCDYNLRQGYNSSSFGCRSASRLGFGPPPAGVKWFVVPAAHSCSIRSECKRAWTVKHCHKRHKQYQSASWGTWSLCRGPAYLCIRTPWQWRSKSAEQPSPWCKRETEDTRSMSRSIIPSNTGIYLM